jgi:FkbM family methyltransferase
MTIFDIGFYTGDDSAYYLSLGNRVIAVEANPELAQMGRQRFASEIQSGRLTILNVAMWHTDGEIASFYVNDTNSEWSALDPAAGKRKGRYHVVDVRTTTIGSLFKDYGVPQYLKIDIEGADGIVLRGLPKAGPLPVYLSCELGTGEDKELVDILSSRGFEHFKLINQDTLTQSTEILDGDWFFRALRMAGTICPPIRSAVAALPDPIRPQRETWDPPRDSSFSESTSGPFGEQSAGKWVSADQIRRRIRLLFRQYERHGKMQRYDLHARHRKYNGGDPSAK